MKQTIKIAIADDHTLFRKGLTAILNSYQHIEVVLDAADGSELLNKLEQIEVLPDVCIVDISMKPMNGYDTVNVLRKQYPQIKTMAISMYKDEFCIISMLRNGARGYVNKDVEPATVVRVVEQLHQHRYYYDGLKPEMINKALHKDGTAYADLTATELQLIQLYCSDINHTEIASLMNMSVRTLEGYKKQLLEKLNISSRPGLIVFAMATGLVQTDAISV